MTTTLVTLLFVGAAALAAASMTMTWRGCRDRVVANLAAALLVPAERTFFVRLVPYAVDPTPALARALHRHARRRARRETLRLAAARRAAA